VVGNGAPLDLAVVRQAWLITDCKVWQRFVY